MRGLTACSRSFFERPPEGFSDAPIARRMPSLYFAEEEALPALGRLGLTVIGVSPDPMKAIEKFASKYGLTFPLASDAEHAIAETYGTWVEKSMYGRKYMGMERTSFLVGPDGKVVQVWRKVKPAEHAALVRKAVEAL